MRTSRAFSLIEVLLVLALVGILFGLVAGNAGAFISGSNFEPPDRVLKRAVLDAVYHAAERKQPTYLAYREQNASFVVTDASGSPLSRHDVYKKMDEKIRQSEDLIPRVVFRAIGPLSGMEGQETKYDDEHLMLARVKFDSGCSVPFSVEIQFREETEETSFDPFSGFVLKQEE